MPRNHCTFSVCFVYSCFLCTHCNELTLKWGLQYLVYWIVLSVHNHSALLLQYVHDDARKTYLSLSWPIELPIGVKKVWVNYTWKFLMHIINFSFRFCDHDNWYRCCQLEIFWNRQHKILLAVWTYFQAKCRHFGYLLL